MALPAGFVLSSAAASPGEIVTFTDPNISGPYWITAGPDGNLWFTSISNSRIGRITPGGAITTFTDPNIYSPEGIVAGPLVHLGSEHAHP